MSPDSFYVHNDRLVLRRLLHRIAHITPMCAVAGLRHTLLGTPHADPVYKRVMKSRSLRWSWCDITVLAGPMMRSD